MSFNLLDAVKGHFSNDLMSKASSFLGESEGGVSKAISGILPSVLGGVISKATSGGSGASDILNMAKDASGSGLLGGIGNMFSGGDLLSKGAGMLKGLLGDKMGGIVDTIAGFAGIKSSSANSLMSMIAPMAMSTIGKHASDNNLDAGGLMNMLSSQKSTIMNALPAGLSSLGGLLGLGKIGDTLSAVTGGAKETVSHTVHAAEDTVGKAGGGLKWLLPLLIALVAALALFYWWKSCNKTEANAPVETHEEAKPVENVPPVVADGASIKVKLPDGTELDALKGGIEDKLVAFLGTDWKSLGEAGLKEKWFDFDNLNFETGSAKLTAESMAQVKNIVAITKAFPDAKLKIGGYTDKVGDDAGNKKLSQSRADAVAAAIKTEGGNAAQLTGAEGYGEEFAKVAETASDEERRSDRRIAVSVRM